MQTKLDLCTMALLKLGEQPIQSLNQDTPAAQLALTLFDSTMDTLLASHPWRFATRRIKLKKNTDGNFLIPSECLRVLRCDGEIFGNHIKIKTLCSFLKTNAYHLFNQISNRVLRIHIKDEEKEEIFY